MKEFPNCTTYHYIDNCKIHESKTWRSGNNNVKIKEFVWIMCVYFNFYKNNYIKLKLTYEVKKYSFMYIKNYML